VVSPARGFACGFRRTSFFVRVTIQSSSLSAYHSTDLLTACGVAYLVVHGTSGSTSYETIPPVPLDSSGGVLSTVDMVVQRRDGTRRLRDNDDGDDIVPLVSDENDAAETKSKCDVRLA